MKRKKYIERSIIIHYDEYNDGLKRSNDALNKILNNGEWCVKTSTLIDKYIVSYILYKYI